MSKKDNITLEGRVVEILPDTMFKVRVNSAGNDFDILARLSGRMKKHNINIVQGDKVRVEVSPYDLSRGRIVFRLK